MPPEVITQSDTNADPKIDVWALGCIMYAMLLGRVPFHGETESELENQIVHSKPKFKIIREEEDGKKVNIAPVISKEA